MLSWRGKRKIAVIPARLLKTTKVKGSRLPSVTTGVKCSVGVVVFFLTSGELGVVSEINGVTDAGLELVQKVENLSNVAT